MFFQFNENETLPGALSCYHKYTSNDLLYSTSPIDNTLLARVSCINAEQYEKFVQIAQENFLKWRNIPAPQRGIFVKRFGQEVQNKKGELAQLITLEMGKPIRESLGEVQEIIDICDFAVGLSRQLYGLTIQSERPEHKMIENWHPLGLVGIITAFNFPMAVWAWNSTISWVCGNVNIWKPSEKTPLCALALHKIVSNLVREMNLPDISFVFTGDYKIGEQLSLDKRIQLISATGSTRMGRQVARNVASRLGKYLLELGGNNAIIITESADFNLVIPSVVFGAIGTAGQRCTSTRRLIIQESIYERVKEALVHAYKQVKIGDPNDEQYHYGPLIDENAVILYEKSIQSAVFHGGKLLYGGKRIESSELKSKNYVLPTLIEVEKDNPIVQEETFAPILYLLKYKTIQEAIEINNQVAQGLSSAIMTLNLRESELFTSQNGSDCGIANINIGTSGAEIGGAFGGEKDTGGGRESGSDSWKNYMRRQTTTINYGINLPLAQGIKFEI
ncbi:L-piperidine-6-carboxylate dehydrogenase [Schleiferia thermophila]|uniref:aldehyde dehydrogenase (NAD(+)) n=1 Tax=Schleiferia thermophila TaxID=884107 RepID=A0A369A3C3_9FLAO|nr:aldehyde dehydrogenase family protein [Schleiferia thermophila]RCX03653.1 aldehyde dehydrogenase (NAD+) [Schleiferia thermophila]GCD79887.1 aldehyde dehydrogenase [Schleiferia thermophila]